ncbi:unnamed protein product [Porites lobata]|uniref:Capsid protein n=1 Tax=Porites lobata TaxID=104759 RepID=A0ABN8PRS5_9CNID|nr:unnamed protein product [Porites lobata]
MGRYVKRHIYGEGVADVFKTIGRKLFGKTMKEAVKTATKKAVQKAATKTGEYAGEKAGDKIIQLLSKMNKTPVAPSPIKNPQTSELSDYLNGKKVYDCNDANHAVNIKNLLDYSLAYAEITASNEFFFLDTSRNAGEREFEVSGTKQLAKRRAAYNKGFALRKALLGTSSTVNTEIPLNRYSFFEMLGDELLPNSRVEMNFEIESGGNLIWQAGADCRVAIPRMQSYVPRITFNSKGQSSYMSQYLKNHAWSEWTSLRENIERSNSSRQRAGHFRISTGISKPRHVFVFIINDANIDAQTANPFLYDTFSVTTDPRTLSNCHLEAGNGNEYPEIHYTLTTDMTRVYRDVLKYVHKNNEYGEGSLLNKSNFSTLFPFLYFDLTKQKIDIKDGTTKLTFKYELSGTTATA